MTEDCQGKPEVVEANRVVEEKTEFPEPKTKGPFDQLEEDLEKIRAGGRI